MKNEKKAKDITPQEVSQWIPIFTWLVKTIQSLFTKKPNKENEVNPQQPTVHPNSDTLTKNQN